MLGVFRPSRRPEVHLVGATQERATCRKRGEVFSTAALHICCYRAAISLHLRASSICESRTQTFVMTLTSMADLFCDIGSDVREIPHG